MVTHSNQSIRDQARMHGEKFLRELDRLCEQYQVTIEPDAGHLLVIPASHGDPPSDHAILELDDLHDTDHQPDEEELQRIIKQNEHVRWLRVGKDDDTCKRSQE